MANHNRIYKYQSLRSVVTRRLRDDLRDAENGGKDFVLLYAYNKTGKTRLSMEFKDVGKRKRNIERDTLYFNAFTEDLFTWNNDLEHDRERYLKLNQDSKFFDGFKELALDERIEKYLKRYATFLFDFNTDEWKVTFRQEVKNPLYREGSNEPEKIMQDNIKISRGEENIFIWCLFLSICEITIDGDEAYDWVKYFYIDDPISSLDDNNTIAIASDLGSLLKKAGGSIKTVISSHHGLFFNVICNELKHTKHKSYFYNKVANEHYTLQSTTDTPFYHHIATLSDLKQGTESGDLYTYHFNSLRVIFEKVSNFFGKDDFSYCLDSRDEVLHARALNLFSHKDSYSIYQPQPMVEDNKVLFEKILTHFLEKFQIELPRLG